MANYIEDICEMDLSFVDEFDSDINDDLCEEGYGPQIPIEELDGFTIYDMYAEKVILPSRARWLSAKNGGSL